MRKPRPKLQYFKNGVKYNDKLHYNNNYDQYFNHIFRRYKNALRITQFINRRQVVNTKKDIAAKYS